MNHRPLKQRERSQWAVTIIILVIILFGMFWWWQKKEAEKQVNDTEPAQTKSDSLDLQISDLEASAVNIPIPDFNKAF